MAHTDTKDAVDEILEQWSEERPELDTASLGVVIRVMSLYREFLRQATLALQEKIVDLEERLGHEREGRRAAEEAARASSGQSLGELEEALREREAALLRLRSRQEESERYARSVGEALGESRQQLEELLAQATTSGDADQAERLGAMLRLLGRFL